MKRTILVVVALLSCALDARAQDFDLDGFPDAIDNCLNTPNTQVDPDLDGYGNRCDGDFDQDGDTDQADFDYYSFNCLNPLIPPAPPVCDLDEDGFIGGLDEFGIMAALIGAPPGPSGLACAGTVPCTAPTAVPGLGGAGMGGLLLALIASTVALLRRRMMA
jgi:hypothetical protein